MFLGVFLYLIGFVGDLPALPRTIDHGPEASLALALAIDLGLIALFGIQHSVMARQGFKRAWTRLLPPPIERSVYLLASCAVLVLLFWLWRPMPAEIWRVTSPAGFWTLTALSLAGWGIALISTYLINHFELFGLQQVWLNLTGKPPAAPELRQPFFYRVVRHPLYSGFLVAFWVTPAMTVGHLVFAAGMTVYILIGVHYEERDLGAFFGEDYAEYRRKVGAVIPGVGRG